jgi:hypothetical protein
MTTSTPTIIKPSIGRVVWYYPSTNVAEIGFARPDEGTPLAAIIARVWSDSMLNLTVFDANGAPHSRTSVPLIQDGQATPQHHGHCEWMPFQKGQANAQEAAKAPHDAVAAVFAARGHTGSSKAMDFGDAIRHIRTGGRVARANWNGKGMWLYLNLGSHNKHEQRTHIDGVSRALFTLGDVGTITRLPNINMRTASGAIVTGWLASQTDVLAEDWIVVSDAACNT